MKPILTTICGILAGCLLTLASWERPETQATPAEQPSVVSVPEVAPATPDIQVQYEPGAPPPAVDVDAYTVVAPQPVLTSYGDCANGTCSAPRAASVRRYQPVTRRGLFGRFRR